MNWGYQHHAHVIDYYLQLDRLEIGPLWDYWYNHPSRYADGEDHADFI
jgi:hypothetical protein